MDVISKKEMKIEKLKLQLDQEKSLLDKIKNGYVTTTYVYTVETGMSEAELMNYLPSSCKIRSKKTLQS